METLKSMSDIDQNSKEGKYLIAAIAILNGSKKVKLMDGRINGRKTEPNDMLSQVGKLKDAIFQDTKEPKYNEAVDDVLRKAPFVTELEALINKHSYENYSNTPDFILAQFIVECLDVFARTTFKREQWYGNFMHPAQNLEKKSNL